MRIAAYALVPDGGTQIVVLETDDGDRLSIGLDGRMDSPVAGLQVFVGSAPEHPDTRLLPIGGSEEAETVALLDRWLEETQGYLRRESLMDADISKLQGQSLRDRLAIEFLLELRARKVD